MDDFKDAHVDEESQEIVILSPLHIQELKQLTKKQISIVDCIEQETLDSGIKASIDLLQATLDLLKSKIQTILTDGFPRIYQYASLGSLLQMGLNRLFSSLDDFWEAAGVSPRMTPRLYASLESALDQAQEILNMGQEKFNTLLDASRRGEPPLGDYPRLLEIAESMPYSLFGAAYLLDFAEDLGPFLEEELKKPQYKNLVLPDFITPPENGQREKTLWDTALEEAYQAVDARVNSPSENKALAPYLKDVLDEEARIQQSRMTLVYLLGSLEDYQEKHGWRVNENIEMLTNALKKAEKASKGAPWSPCEVLSKALDDKSIKTDLGEYMRGQMEKAKDIILEAEEFTHLDPEIILAQGITAIGSVRRDSRFKAEIEEAIRRRNADALKRKVGERGHVGLTRPFIPMLTGAPFRALDQASFKKGEMDPIGGTITVYDPKHDGEELIRKFDEKIKGTVGVPAKKILDVAKVQLTQNNPNKANGDSVNPTVVIDLIEFWEASGLSVRLQKGSTEQELAKLDELKKNLKKQLREDLDAIRATIWKGPIKDGKKVEYANYSYISSFQFLKGDLLRINFDIDIATFIVQKGLLKQWSPLLLLHDNRDHNSYVIGLKILEHWSIDSNFEAGTDCTLSVRTLLGTAPDIPTFEELRSDTLLKGEKRKGGPRRDWKQQIKAKLEKALDENVKVQVLKQWQYRNPATGKTYTKADADRLIWDDYKRLMVDYVVNGEPEGQAARRQKRAAEKAERQRKAAEKAATTPKKRRGRPPKIQGAPN